MIEYAHPSVHPGMNVAINSNWRRVCLEIVDDVFKILRWEEKTGDEIRAFWIAGEFDVLRQRRRVFEDERISLA